MTRNCLWCLLAVLFVIPMTAVLNPLAAEETASPEAAQPSGDAPVMRLSEYSFDLGAIFHGEILHRTIKVRNEGAAPLEVHKVYTSCSCTVIEKFTPSIAPGEEGEIALSIEPKKVRPGKTQKRITIECNDPQRVQSEIWFTAKIEVPWKAKPTEVKMTGPWDKSKVASVTLSPGTHLTFDVLDAKTRNGYANVESVAQPFGVKRTISLTAPPAEKPGTLKDALDITVRLRDGKVLTTGVWVIVDHLESVICDPPNQLLFLNKDTDALLNDDKPVVKTIRLKSSSLDHTFKVVDVKFEDLPPGLFEAEVTPRVEGKDYTVTVQLNEYREETYLQGRILILTDDATYDLKLFAKFGRKRS